MKKGPLFEIIVIFFTLISYYFFWDFIKTMIASAKESFFGPLYLILFLLFIYAVLRIFISLSTFFFLVLPSKVISRFGWAKVLAVVVVVVLALVWWYYPDRTTTPDAQTTPDDQDEYDFERSMCKPICEENNLQVYYFIYDKKDSVINCVCINPNNNCERGFNLDLIKNTTSLYLDQCK